MEENIAEQVFDCLFPIEKSIRYHQRRRAFYDGWHRWLMLGVILAGSTSVTDAFGTQEALGILAAFFGAVDLVFAFSDRARDHEFLMRRFSELLAKIKRCASPELADLIAWKTERIQIEADEPAVYWGLEAACYNEATRALDRDRKDEVRLPWWARVFGNYLHFDPTRFRAVGEMKSAF